MFKINAITEGVTLIPAAISNAPRKAAGILVLGGVVILCGL